MTILGENTENSLSNLVRPKQGIAAAGDTQLWGVGGAKDGDKEGDMKAEERESRGLYIWVSSCMQYQ